MDTTTPNFSGFRRLARQGTVVPVYRTVVADLLSPVSAFLKLAPEAFKGPRMHGKQGVHHSFLLESVEGGERVGRYTYFGVDPFQVITCSCMIGKWSLEVVATLTFGRRKGFVSSS